MRTFLAKKSPDLSAREIAQGSLTANLAIPGLGSVVAGRKVGFVQMAVYFSGFGLTICFGLRFVVWALSHWSQFYAEFYSPDADVITAMNDLWLRTRWALLGIALFVISWVWAFSTSRALLAAAKRENGANKPAPL
jgi:hypothetical protein